MSDTEKMVEINMASSVELSSSLLEQLGKALVELATHNTVPSTLVPWTDVEAHFRNLELIAKKTFEELEAKEKEFTERESHNHMVFAEKEAAVLAKEQDLLDRVQELKDAAVAEIDKARANHKVSSSVDDEIASIDPQQERKSPHEKIEGNVEGVAVEVNPCAELTQICEQMDSLGLLKLVLENLENLSSRFKDQLSVALGSAIEPACLVLDALEGFFPPKEMTQEGDNDDVALRGMRQSCLILMEALSAFLSKAGCAATDSFLSPETKQRAKFIANEWKLKLTLENINGNALEAEGFLRLLGTFRIASEFDEEELCKYVLAVAHHWQATELCRSLDLTQKIPGWYSFNRPISEDWTKYASTFLVYSPK